MLGLLFLFFTLPYILFLAVCFILGVKTKKTGLNRLFNFALMSLLGAVIAHTLVFGMVFFFAPHFFGYKGEVELSSYFYPLPYIILFFLGFFAIYLGVLGRGLFKLGKVVTKKRK